MVCSERLTSLGGDSEPLGLFSHDFFVKALCGIRISPVIPELVTDQSSRTAPIHVGIGGWTYAPWRGTFYPDKWPQKRELEFASRQLTAIEINGTFYSRFKPQNFAGWRAAVPDGFVFALKGSRYCTNRKVLADAGEAVASVVEEGIVELGETLGPILWQFAATKRFDADDFAAFLRLLPTSHGGVPLRHAVHVRHESFATPDFIAMCRAARVPIAYGHSDEYPAIADVTGDFVYARIENAVEDEAAGHATATLDRWAEAARTWAGGGMPAALPHVDAAPPPCNPRETFMFMIGGAKVRAPAAAVAIIDRLGTSS